MLVSYPLLIDSNSFNRQDAVTRLQPPRIELIVGDDEEEDHSQGGSQAAIDKEDDFPGSNGGAMLSRAHGNTVGDQTAEYLPEAVEREPDTSSCALFLLGPPLRGDEGEPGRHGGLEDTQKDCIRR